MNSLGDSEDEDEEIVDIFNPKPSPNTNSKLFVPKFEVPEIDFLPASGDCRDFRNPSKMRFVQSENSAFRRCLRRCLNNDVEKDYISSPSSSSSSSPSLSSSPSPSSLSSLSFVLKPTFDNKYVFPKINYYPCGSERAIPLMDWRESSSIW